MSTHPTGIPPAGPSPSIRETEAIDWQRKFAEEHGRLPKWAELKSVGSPHGTFRRYKRFVIDRNALSRRYLSNPPGPASRCTEDEAIDWQRKFAEEHGRLPKWAELKSVGSPHGTFRRYKRFVIDRNALSRRYLSNPPGRASRRTEDEAIDWQRKFAEEHERLPPWAVLKAVGFFSGTCRRWKRFMAERMALTLKYRKNVGGRRPIVTEGQAIAWQRDFAEKHTRLPMWRELGAAGIRSGRSGAWTAFRKERRTLTHRYPMNCPILVRLDNGQWTFLPLSAVPAASVAADKAKPTAARLASAAAANGHADQAVAAAPPAGPAGTSPGGRSRFGPKGPRYDRKADQQILQAWKTGQYATKEELARQLGITPRDVERAIAREKMRLRRTGPGWSDAASALHKSPPVKTA